MQKKCIPTVIVCMDGRLAFHYAVVLREHDGGSEGLGLLEIHRGIGDDDDGIAHLDPAGSSSVETDAATAALAADDIGLEAFAVVVVEHLDLLAGNEIGGIHEVLVDGDAAHIVKIGLGDLNTMKFGLQYFYLHIESFRYRYRFRYYSLYLIWSMRRMGVLPQ